MSVKNELRKKLQQIVFIAQNSAKWAPRKGKDACDLSVALGFPLQRVERKASKEDGGVVTGTVMAQSKEYRKYISSLTKVVEQQMCAKEWDQITFDHVPSVAAARYQKAFNKRCGDAYRQYRDGLNKVDPKTGETERKINAGAVYPYDIVKSVKTGDRAVAQAQWNALPNFLSDNKILPIVDSSGSMGSWSYYGQKAPIKTNVMPIDVAVSIGLYCADKQTGAFSGMFMNFDARPKLKVLTGDLVSKIQQIERAEWGGNTDIEAAFDLILSTARKNKVSIEDMPKVLLILSDMEFDGCCRYGSQRVTNYNNAKAMFEASGYELPTVVFWNINSRSNNNPVTMHTSGTCIVSGFSPSIFKSVLKTDMDSYTPYNVMLDVLKSERYDIDGLTV